MRSVNTLNCFVIILGADENLDLFKIRQHQDMEVVLGIFLGNL